MVTKEDHLIAKATRIRAVATSAFAYHKGCGRVDSLESMLETCEHSALRPTDTVVTSRTLIVAFPRTWVDAICRRLIASDLLRILVASTAVARDRALTSVRCCERVFMLRVRKAMAQLQLLEATTE